MQDEVKGYPVGWKKMGLFPVPKKKMLAPDGERLHWTGCKQVNVMKV